MLKDQRVYPSHYPKKTQAMPSGPQLVQNTLQHLRIVDPSDLSASFCCHRWSFLEMGIPKTMGFTTRYSNFKWFGVPPHFRKPPLPISIHVYSCIPIHLSLHLSVNTSIDLSLYLLFTQTRACNIYIYSIPLIGTEQTHQYKQNCYQT